MYTLLVTLAGVASAFPGLPGHGTISRQASGLSRSPCPALNVLANIGKLPNSGKNITVPMFQQALTEVYNVDPSFATTLATQALQGLPHADAGPTALHLADLNKHDVIEHDASLTRLDAIQGDNHSVQPKLVEALLADATGDFLTVQSLAKSRARREAESKQAGSPALSAKATTLAYGEAALLLQVLGHLGPVAKQDGSDFLVPKAAAKTWMLDEKLPAGWKKPPYVISLSSTTAVSAKVAAAKVVAGAVSGAASLLDAAAKGAEQVIGKGIDAASAAAHNAGAGHGASSGYGARVH